MSETEKIFFPGQNADPEKLSEDTLMAYLEGKLSPAEQHKIEHWLTQEGMESDALEGLHKLRSAEARKSIKRINYKLHKTLSDKKRARRPLNTDQFTWIAIALILMLIVLAYIVIRKSL